MASLSFFRRAVHLFVRCAFALLCFVASIFQLHAQIAGKAVTLKGTDYVRTTLWSGDLFDSRNFTFEFWFNATSPGVLVGETDTQTATAWDVTFAEVFAGGVIKAGAPNVPTITVGTITFGTWNHLAVVYNQTNQTLSAYLNGALAASSVGPRKIPSDNGRNAVYTFGRGGPTNLAGGAWYVGLFDEIRIWRNARTASDIANSWNRLITSDQPGLMALWHLDVASGSRSPDSRSAATNPAWYVPDTSTIPLVTSTAPLFGPGPGIATKGAAIAGTSATMQGMANPTGSPLSVFFQWGSTTAYGNNTTTNAIGSGNADVNFSETLNDLAFGTYHFRAVGVSGDSTFAGADQTFMILAPTATTLPATVTGNGVELSGACNPNGIPTTANFEWGATSSYGNNTPARDIGSGTSGVKYSEILSNLAPGIYHFRAVGSYNGGVATGNDVTFTVLPPSVETKNAVVTNALSTLQGAANPQGVAANVYFQWGPSIAYGNSTPLQPIGSGASFVNFSQTISNLAAGEYHFRAILTNSTQEIVGSDQLFTILGPSGNAAKLVGNDYIRTTIWTDTMFTNNDFTFELWFNATSPGVLINEADTSDPGVWDKSFAEIFPGGVIKAGVPGVPTFIVGTIDFGTWHHLALIYDSTAKVLAAYLDGQTSGTSPGTRTSPADIHRTSIYCFGRGGETNLGGGNWYSGLIDEVRIWRRPLAADEIAVQYNKILNVADPGLVANWHLDTILALGVNYYLSPDASGKNNFAWYVPQTVFPLVPSTAPVVPDLRPLIMTNSARAVAPFTVELTSTVVPQGTNNTIVYFEYGRSNVFQPTPAQQIGSASVPVSFSSGVSGSEVGSSYNYRVVASNAFGVSRSVVSQFTVTDWAGYAYRLAPNDYLRTTNDLSEQFPDKSITVELWFYPRGAGVLASETVFTNSYDRAVIEILPSANVQAGFNGLTPISVGDATLNAWNHVALRYDAATSTMQAFLNGVKSVSRTGARITPTASGLQTQYAFGRAAATKLGTGDYFTGDLDEIRVWNLARTDQDLTTARFNLLAGDEPGLVFDWRGNPPATDPIFDISPHANNGSNMGADVIPSTAPLMFGSRPVGADQLEAQFVVKPGSTFILQSSSDLANWTPVSTNTAPASGYVRLPLSIGSQSGGTFFRVVPE